MIPQISPSELLTFETVKRYEEEDYAFLQVGWKVNYETDDSIVFKLKEWGRLVLLTQDRACEAYLSKHFSNFHFVCYDTEFQSDNQSIYDYTVYFQEKANPEIVYSLTTRYKSSEISLSKRLRNQTTRRIVPYEFMYGNEQDLIQVVAKTYWNCLINKNPIRMLALTGVLKPEDLI